MGVVKNALREDYLFQQDHESKCSKSVTMIIASMFTSNKYWMLKFKYNQPITVKTTMLHTFQFDFESGLFADLSISYNNPACQSNYWISQFSLEIRSMHNQYTTNVLPLISNKASEFEYFVQNQTIMSLRCRLKISKSEFNHWQVHRFSNW